MGTSTVNVAIVGLGYWGANLVRTFANADGVRITAVCDVDAQLLAALGETLPGARRTVHYREILASDGVDAVVLATPPSSHHLLALAALHMGKHVWVEKPLALTAAHGRELVDAAHASGRVLFVDETFLYDPLIREAKRLIDEGALGRLYHLSFERLGMGRIRRDSNVWWNSAPHDVAVLLYLVSSPIVRARLSLHAHLRAGIADMAVCDVELASGVSAHIYLSWLHPEKTARMSVVGSERMLFYEGRFEKRGLMLYDYALDMQERHGNLVPVRHLEGRRLEMPDTAEPLAAAAAHFVDSIRAGTEPLTSGRRSLHVVEMLEAAENAANRGAADT